MNGDKFGSTLVSAMLLALSLVTPPAAAEWECPQMKQFVDLMYEAADYLNHKPRFDENPKLEADIDRLLPLLAQLAREEEVEGFTRAVDETRAVWAKEVWSGDDINQFRRAFDSVTVNLERIYEHYCR